MNLGGCIAHGHGGLSHDECLHRSLRDVLQRRHGPGGVYPAFLYEHEFGVLCDCEQRHQRRDENQTAHYSTSLMSQWPLLTTTW